MKYNLKNIQFHDYDELYDNLKQKKWSFKDLKVEYEEYKKFDVALDNLIEQEIIKGYVDPNYYFETLQKQYATKEQIEIFKTLIEDVNKELEVLKKIELKQDNKNDLELE